MKKSELIQDFFFFFFFFNGVNSSGIKITLIEVIKNDMLIKEVTKGMTIDTIKWEKNTSAHHDSLNAQNFWGLNEASCCMLLEVSAFPKM